MTNVLELSCTFHHSRNPSVNISLPSGLHVIYGESNTGKSDLIRQLVGQNSSKRFAADSNVSPSLFQVIMQNPDHQIVQHSIKKELAFSSECVCSDPEKIQDEVLRLKSELLFEIHELQHPATLSGGEKEILNIVTGLSVPSSVYCLDDALSFLSQKNKDQMIQYIQKHIAQTSTHVLWFTSDITDIKYGDTSWEFSSSSLKIMEGIEHQTYPSVDRNRGGLEIAINDLSFGYFPDKLIFNDFNKKIKNVQCLGVVGKNGCGKSTLSFLMLELLQSNSGTIKLRVNQQKSSIGYLDQFPERMLGANSLKMFTSELIDGHLLQSNALKNIISELEEWGIQWEQWEDKPAMDVPWSILRITMIVILASSEYDVMILDEPTFGLGWKQKVNLHGYLDRLFQKKYGIILSHDLEFVDSICDEILTLK